MEIKHCVHTEIGVSIGNDPIKKIDQFNTFLLLNIKVENKLNAFLKSTHVLDAYQKNCFEKVNPEIYNLIKRYANLED